MNLILKIRLFFTKKTVTRTKDAVYSYKRIGGKFYDLKLEEKRSSIIKFRTIFP